MDEPLLRLDLTGHPAVRATHAKTIEFGHDDAITERATCVIGVRSRLAAGGPFAGPVRFTVTVDGQVATVDALGNPGWRPDGPAVLRRSADRRGDTIATDADRAAADLPRELVARLADPAARIAVTARRLPRRRDGRAGLVLLWAPPDGTPDGRLLAEVAAADAVVAQDPGAAALVGDGVAASVAAGGLTDGTLGRVLVVATVELPGGTVRAALTRPDLVAVEVAGLPPTSAVVAASPATGPVLQAGVVARGRIDATLRAAPPGAGLVLTVAAADLLKLSETALRRGRRSAALLDPTAAGPVTWAPVGELRSARTSGSVVVLLDPAEPGTGVDGDLAAFVTALLADGVSARSVAMALAGQPGWTRRTAYAAVLAMRPAP